MHCLERFTLLFLNEDTLASTPFLTVFLSCVGVVIQRMAGAANDGPNSTLAGRFGPGMGGGKYLRSKLQRFGRAFSSDMKHNESLSRCIPMYTVEINNALMSLLSTRLLLNLKYLGIDCSSRISRFTCCPAATCHHLWNDIFFSGTLSFTNLQHPYVETRI